jgi:hypothetical protein
MVFANHGANAALVEAKRRAIERGLAVTTGGKVDDFGTTASITMTSTAEIDNSELVDAMELRLLRNVFAKSSDLVKSRHWEEFRDAYGGIEKLEAEHEQAVADLERWYSDADDN